MYKNINSNEKYSGVTICCTAVDLHTLYEYLSPDYQLTYQMKVCHGLKRVLEKGMKGMDMIDHHHHQPLTHTPIMYGNGFHSNFRCTPGALHTSCHKKHKNASACPSSTGYGALDCSLSLYFYFYFNQFLGKNSHYVSLQHIKNIIPASQYPH